MAFISTRLTGHPFRQRIVLPCSHSFGNSQQNQQVHRKRCTSRFAAVLASQLADVVLAVGSEDGFHWRTFEDCAEAYINEQWNSWLRGCGLWCDYELSQVKPLNCTGVAGNKVPDVSGYWYAIDIAAGLNFFGYLV